MAIDLVRASRMMIDALLRDLVAFGFPDLLPYVLAQDFEGLHFQCQVFDQRLRQFLTEHDVPLNDFATLEELGQYLDIPERQNT